MGYFSFLVQSFVFYAFAAVADYPFFYCTPCAVLMKVC